MIWYIDTRWLGNYSRKYKRRPVAQEVTPPHEVGPRARPLAPLQQQTWATQVSIIFCIILVFLPKEEKDV